MIHIPPGDTGGRLDDGNPTCYKPPKRNKFEKYYISRRFGPHSSCWIINTCSTRTSLGSALHLHIQMARIERLISLISFKSEINWKRWPSDVGGQCRAAGSHSRSHFSSAGRFRPPGNSLTFVSNRQIQNKNEFHFIFFFLQKLFRHFSVAVSWISSNNGRLNQLFTKIYLLQIYLNKTK